MKALIKEHFKGYVYLIIALFLGRFFMKGELASSYKTFMGMLLISLLYFPLVYVREKYNN